MSFDIRKHVDNTIEVVMGVATISIIGGIVGYVLYQFDSATNGTVKAWFNMFNNTNTLVGTVVTILLVAVIAGVGIGLIEIFRKKKE